MEKDKDFETIIMHPDFNETLNDLGKGVSNIPNPVNLDYGPDNNFLDNSFKLEVIGKIERIKLNAKNGYSFFSKQKAVYAYDESFDQYNALEGKGFLTCHSLVLVAKKYLPICSVTLNFYTKSKLIKGDSKALKYSLNADLSFKKDYHTDRINLFEKYVKNSSILLIDGPLIAGDAYVLFIKAIDKILEKNICSIFFVKNSGGDIITENLKEFKGKYNNDLHWSSQYLSVGECTNFFKYIDPHSNKNARVFCFIKAFDASPQRIEFHIDTFIKYKSIMNDIIDMVYYLLLVQGDRNNPQVRPIAIAEKYARDVKHLFDITKMLKETGIKATMNQERFG